MSLEVQEAKLLCVNVVVFESDMCLRELEMPHAPRFRRGEKELCSSRGLGGVFFMKDDYDSCRCTIRRLGSLGRCIMQPMR